MTAQTLYRAVTPTEWEAILATGGRAFPRRTADQPLVDRLQAAQTPTGSPERVWVRFAVAREFLACSTQRRSRGGLEFWLSADLRDALNAQLLGPITRVIPRRRWRGRSRRRRYRW